MRSNVRRKALKPQSPTLRKISTCQLPAPRNVLHNIIPDYTSFCLFKFVEKSVEPSRTFAVFDVTIKAVHATEWSHMRIKSEESIPQAVVFIVIWRGRNLNPRVSEGDDNYHINSLVYVAKLSSPSTSSETIIEAYSCLQHPIKEFPCRHIN